MTKTSSTTYSSKAKHTGEHELPTLSVTVFYKSRRTGKSVTRVFVVTKRDINDIPWYGGNCGDSYFDDAFESDEDRFSQRVEDYAHYLLWESDANDNRLDPELNGDHAEGQDYHDRLELEWETDFDVADFYPI
jgi:hypothetical protein